MTDRAQFEAMLEALINDDQQAAKEIFHNIVVGKSREIYEELLESDFGSDQGNPYGKKDDKDDEDDSEDESMGDEEDDMDSEEDDMDSEEDDMDSEEDDMDSEEEPEGDIEDRVMDLEDALEDLKAEFEQLLSQEGDDDMGGEDDLESEMENQELGELTAEYPGGSTNFSTGEVKGTHTPEPEVQEMHHVHHHVNEYVNKVSLPKHGDNGVNTRSAVAGKNNMGGSSANIAKSFSTEKGGTQGGLLKPTTAMQDGGNINKPGASAGKSAFKKKEPGHGPESKGKGETADNKKSLISTKVR